MTSDDDEECSNDSNRGGRTAQWIESQTKLRSTNAFTQPKSSSCIQNTSVQHSLPVPLIEISGINVPILPAHNIPLQPSYRPTTEVTSIPYIERRGTEAPVPPASNMIPQLPTTEIIYCQPALSTYQPRDIPGYQQNDYRRQIPVVSNMSNPQVPYYTAPSTFPLVANISRLTSEQIAAMSKDLPSFSRKPEEWPHFYSAFSGSTDACNFSNQENMLQRCLKGRALDVVRCRLMLPSSVPEVVETLRIMFGRPELVVHTLLTKLRNKPAPKAEKLESLVTFAFSVQNISATIEASGLLTHLSNPMLI